MTRSADALPRAGRPTARSLRARLTARTIGLIQNGWVQKLAWSGDVPHPRWHSFDRTPWKHPWLTPENLRRAKAHSRSVLARAGEISGRKRQRLQFGFVGNVANSLYTSAVALRRFGLGITVYPIPDDDFVMSEPGWEEFDGTLPEGAKTMADLAAHGISLPRAEGVVRPGDTDAGAAGKPSLFTLLRRARFADGLRWPDYFHTFLSMMTTIQRSDAMLTLQRPYFAYFSGRPYLAAQMGGDIWFESARDDELGRLQRRAFASASAYLASNPWAYAHARRYGMRHLVYLPQILDEEVYSPGTSECRREWQAQTGGTFFVLSTARADDLFKGTRIALEGFVRFAREIPGARLLMLGWGKDLDARLRQLADLGIADKVAVLPVSGKKRVIQYLRGADCLLDQFAVGYFGATALEAMGCGLPVVMRIERAQYDSLCETGAPPVLDASSADEVHAALKLLASDSGVRARASAAHREWLLANHSAKRWHLEYEHLLAATALGHRFDFSGSPLMDRLGPDEIEYHREQLAHAPQFPHYY